MGVSPMRPTGILPVAFAGESAMGWGGLGSQ